MSFGCNENEIEIEPQQTAGDAPEFSRVWRGWDSRNSVVFRNYRINKQA